ncbi:MAG: hypothetical protein ACLQFR_15420 [Streptosporangiaceae bacterium]
MSRRGLARVEDAQRRAVQQPVERGPDDRPQILTLAAWKIQVEPAHGVRLGESVAEVQERVERNWIR